MKLAFNKDWLILGGTFILGVTALVALHNRFSGLVPTVPGVSYGPGGVATGIYTGQGPYKPVPIAQDVYGPIGGIGGPLVGQVQGIGRQGIGMIQNPPFQGYLGVSSGMLGRGALRDAWTDVYDAHKTGAMITHDDPDRRVSLA